MTPRLQRAFGYQGDPMNLPVPDLSAALPFYENVLGFHVLARGAEPHQNAVLARDDIQMALCENGGDPTQDGCAFHVTDVEALGAEFRGRGLNPSEFSIEQHDGVAWKVFYVIAPDGLCFWFGERQVA